MILGRSFCAVSSSRSEVPPLVLLELDALEERLEVARPEPLVVVALDQLDEHRRPVLQRLREDLEADEWKGILGTDKRF